jgi:hypothetical protein
MLAVLEHQVRNDLRADNRLSLVVYELDIEEPPQGASLRFLEA